ncbi:MAG: cysteine dioxygenase family protein [Oligoflexia bacterium]|nr:cysteine dioxygenase family protein [Oligoflexia bacterium]
MFDFPKLRPLKSYLDSLKQSVELDTLGQVLRECEVTAQDVQSACLFCDEHYQRNLIAQSAWYDLLVLCWKPGQASLIHDHANSRCGFKILKGVATETVYSRIPTSPEYVAPRSNRSYQQGQICLAEDRDIHKISNESSTEALITLHCYSPPLKMSVYKLADDSLQDPQAKLVLTGRQESPRR